MCMICTEYMREAMTLSEAYRAAGEVLRDENATDETKRHIIEMLKKLEGENEK